MTGHAFDDEISQGHDRKIFFSFLFVLSLVITTSFAWVVNKTRSLLICKILCVVPKLLFIHTSLPRSHDFFMYIDHAYLLKN